eukprot:TRINITY_DN1133_c0_g1_i2.p2 TRINITY_DN1133_c0_g1~~TRINITY_DN1133_c0_g1_i2.p2  ORF type:complete len:120 (-),score=23.22 TRINITY_DN1133_c0_g1_i2:223-582(-)
MTTGQPQVVVVQQSHVNNGQWAASLCDCQVDECGACLYAWCCTHQLYAHARSQFDGGDTNFYLMAPPCFNYSVVRNGYGVAGSCMGDLCKPIWCPCCAAQQMYHETKVRGPRPKAMHIN